MTPLSDKLATRFRSPRNEIQHERFDANLTKVSKDDEMTKPEESARGSRRIAGALDVESVADILERELQTVIREWLARVEKEPDLARIHMNHEDRTGHLPRLLQDVIKRLRLGADTKAPISEAAADHEDLRRIQGYTVAMAVEESRLLQVSIFTTLHNNVKHLEFSHLLPDVVTIADEVDAQLKEQMLRFMAEDTAEKTQASNTFWEVNS
jgi:hypothetical protein